MSLWLLGIADLRTDWDSMVDAEKSFAAASLTKGTKDAFLSVLADDSIIFRPRAVPGKKWMQDNPAPTSQLSWIPEFADISRAGDLGYTTGPWEIRRSPQDGPYAFGHYVTLWRKQANGAWKVELDYGISHEKVLPPEKVYSPPLPKGVARAAGKAQADEAIAAIKNADRMASSSLLTYFAGDVRLYREDYLPYITKSAATRRLGETPGTMTSNQLAVRVSASADLGYSYGTAEFKPRDASKQVEYGNYVRIWKKQTDGSWKIVLDLLSSAPKP